MIKKIDVLPVCALPHKPGCRNSPASSVPSCRRLRCGRVLAAHAVSILRKKKQVRPGQNQPAKKGKPGKGHWLDHLTDKTIRNESVKKVLLNATTLNKGGGIQASASFIRSALLDETTEWSFAVSGQVDEEIRKYDIPLEKYRKASMRFDISPARSLKARKALLAYAGAVDPRVVFTFFGPAYIKFPAPHLCGVANGQVTHAGFMIYRKLGSLKKMASLFLGTIYRGYWYTQADRWVVEAEVAKNGLARRFGVDREKVSVVPNSCGQQFFDYVKQARPKNDVRRILVVSAYYPHKNLEIIPFVAEQLIKRFNFDKFEFSLTLDPNLEAVQKIVATAQRLGVDKHIRLLGFIYSKDLPALYNECDMTFLPTLLETFSASYPESMQMGLPIVTTDLDFAHNACADAAEYFNHSDPAAAAASIHKVLTNESYAAQLIQKGHAQVKTLPNPEMKFRSYMDIIDSMG